MKQYILADGSFLGSPSATSFDRIPKHFEWVRNTWHTPIVSEGSEFFTDICLTDALASKAPKKIAWLLEPPSINSRSYTFVQDHWEVFDHVLSYHEPFVERGALMYPFGGTHVQEKDWGMHEKKYATPSAIFSMKKKTIGHRMRHAIAKGIGYRIHLYGSGYNPITNKITGLKDYMFQIVVENEQSDWWFTEKLIDCFLTGTIPIYWGARKLGDFFDMRGVIPFSIINQLGVYSEELYEEMLPYAQANFELAQAYVCAEDWIYDAYPYLFI